MMRKTESKLYHTNQNEVIYKDSKGKMRGDGSITESNRGIESSVNIESIRRVDSISNIESNRVMESNTNTESSTDTKTSLNIKSHKNTESNTTIKSSTTKQLTLYFIIGGLITLFELAGFYVLYKFFGLHYIFASLIMFVLASGAGIVLYRRFIFGDSQFSSSLEIVASYLINTIGVGINTLILWLLVEFMGLEAIYAKVIASLLVAFYGFYMRKILIYKRRF